MYHVILSYSQQNQPDNSLGRFFKTKKLVILSLLLASISGLILCTSTPNYKWDEYPKVRRDHKLIYQQFKFHVSDPYRWFENAGSEESENFMNAQNALTDKYLNQFESIPKFAEKLTAMFEHEQVSAPSKHGDYYYYWYNPSRLNHSIFVRQLKFDGSPEVFFDPNAFAPNSRVSSISKMVSFSKNAAYFTYCRPIAGSLSVTIHVKNVADKTDLPDLIRADKYQYIKWTSDNLGFFYNVYES